MKHIVLISLVAVVFVACKDGTSPIDAGTGFETANFTINDGSRPPDGNEDVFFLPPLVVNPRGNADFRDRDANPDLGPVARICETDEVSCVSGQIGADLPMVFEKNDQFYKVEWKTKTFDLESGNVYRIQIFLGTVLLAHRDVQPVDEKRPKCEKVDVPVCEFKNGDTLPIKVRIETGALCIELGGDPDVCATATLPPGGKLDLKEDDETLGIAEVDDGATISMQTCTDLRSRGTGLADINIGRVDLRTFGKCIEIISLDLLSAQGTASLCNPFTPAQLAVLSDEQIARMTVHRFGEGPPPSTVALPHSEGPVCPPPAAPAQALELNSLEQFVRFARNTWRAVSDQVRAWIEPAPLWAKMAVRCNRGGCSGIGEFRSSFMVTGPGFMDHVPPTFDGVFGDVLVGTVLTLKVNVTDSGELEPVTEGGPILTPVPDPIEGVRLTFTATEGGSISAPAPAVCVSGTTCTVETDASGNAEVTLNVILDANTVLVQGIGVGTVGLAGTTLNVFGPSINDEFAAEVELGIGTLTFSATGIQPDLIVETLTHTPASPTNVDLITFTATVKNVGTAVAPASTLEFLVAGEATGASGTLFAVPAIPAGSDFAVLRDTILPPDSYTNTATADFNDDVDEINEGADNTETDGYTVVAAPILIYGPSLLNETAFRPDNERTFAIDEGFTVVVKNAGDWALLTEAEFKGFSAIVIGDRGGLGVLATAEANKAVWSAAITGPVIISALNPAVHQCDLDQINCLAAFPQPAGTIVNQPEAITLIKNAINFAASGAGTGAYISLDNHFAGAGENTPISFLSEIGAFQVVGLAGFTDLINIVATTHPVMATLSNAGLSGWFASNHQFIQAFPASYTLLAESDRNIGTVIAPVFETLAVIIACSPDESTDCVMPSGSAPASFDVAAGPSPSLSKIAVPKNIR